MTGHDPMALLPAGTAVYGMDAEWEVQIYDPDHTDNPDGWRRYGRDRWKLADAHDTAASAEEKTGRLARVLRRETRWFVEERP